FDDIQDKAIAAVVDAKRAIARYSRPMIVEIIAKARGDVPVDIGPATTDHTPTGCVEFVGEVEFSAKATKRINPGSAVARVETIEQAPFEANLGFGIPDPRADGDVEIATIALKDGISAAKEAGECLRRDVNAVGDDAARRVGALRDLRVHDIREDAVAVVP